MSTKVLFVHSGDDWIRGSEVALLTVLRSCAHSDIVPFVLCNQKAFASEVEKLGIECQVYPIPQIMIDGGICGLNLVQWALTLKRVRKLTRQWDIDLLYSNGGRPCQVLYSASRMSNRPLVCHVHIGYAKRYTMLYQIDRAGKVIFVSRENEERMCSKRAFAGSHEVVYNGVDTDRFTPVARRRPELRDKWAIPRDAFVVGQIASLIPRKGPDVLLRAFRLVVARHPQARLVFVGDGAASRQLSVLANDLAIQRFVTFTDLASDTAPWFQHALDLHVLASRDEGMPISLAEAAACGLPNIGAQTGGIPEVVLDGRNGLLFERENYEMLAEKICHVIQRPQMAREFGAAGRALALERFSVQSYTQSIHRIILEQAANAARN